MHVALRERTPTIFLISFLSQYASYIFFVGVPSQGNMHKKFSKFYFRRNFCAIYFFHSESFPLFKTPFYQYFSENFFQKSQTVFCLRFFEILQ
jgi:hypothetical protein